MKIFKNQTLLTLACLFFLLKIQAQCPPSTSENLHTVQKGETLYGISKKYKVSVADICTWNNRKQSDPLAMCTQLYVKAPQKAKSKTEVEAQATEKLPKGYNNIPAKKNTTPSVTESTTFKQRSAKGTHIVKEGETIASIAAFYGYTEARFREFNMLMEGTEVEPGSILLSSDCTYFNENQPATSATTASQVDIPQSYNEISKPKTQPTQPIDEFELNDKSSSTITPKTPESGDLAPVLRKTSAPYMRDEDLTMLDEINLVRSNPKGYIKYIEEYISDMRQNGEFGNSIQTAYELIDELKATPQLSILEPMECLYIAARKHANDQRPTGDVNHQGTDGSWPWDRALRECPSFKDGNENIVGGPASIRRSVILLLVDDGIPTRGHRKTMLQPNWRYGSCYKVGTVGEMPNVWVQYYGY